VRQAIEFGAIAHIETASEELADEVDVPVSLPRVDKRGQYPIL